MKILVNPRASDQRVSKGQQLKGQANLTVGSQQNDAKSLYIKQLDVSKESHTSRSHAHLATAKGGNVEL